MNVTDRPFSIERPPPGFTPEVTQFPLAWGTAHSGTGGAHQFIRQTAFLVVAKGGQKTGTRPNREELEPPRTGSRADQPRRPGQRHRLLDDGKHGGAPLRRSSAAALRSQRGATRRRPGTTVGASPRRRALGEARPSPIPLPPGDTTRDPVGRPRLGLEGGVGWI